MNTHVPPPPAFDQAEAEHFLGLLDPAATAFTFQTFGDAVRAKPDRLAQVIPGCLNDPRLHVKYKYGAGVFVTVNETDGKGRTKATIVRVRAIWCEDDNKDAASRTFPIPPSIVVESSPGKRHNYWLVADEWRPDKRGTADFDGVMRRMIADHGSDKGVKDISRVLRVPGFLHRKNPATPHLVKLLDANGHRYTRAEILAAFPPIPPGEKYEGKTGSVGDESDFELIADIVNDITFYDSLLKLAARYVGRGMYGGAIVKTLYGYMDNVPPEDRDDRWQERRAKIPELVESAEEKFRKPPPHVSDAPPTQPGDDDEEIFDAAELEKMEFDPVKSVVPGVFVEGLTLFCGKPKLGKSWLLLHAAHAIASGGFTLGSTHCVEGDVLYCSLEDNKRRLKSRMRKLFADRSRSPRLKFKIKMPRLAEGGINVLREWIKSVPKPRLVAIDTLAMVRMPNRKDQSAYDADYAAVIELRNLAHEFGIAIVVVHHVRKMDADDPFDTISGTLGLTGCPDSLVILKRDATGTMLLGRGRDLEEIEKAITFNKQSCAWTIEGDADEVRRSTQQQAILATLQEANMPMTPKQIAGDVGMKVQNVKRLLGKMVAEGILQKAGYGEYKLAAKKQEKDFG